jgi:hypothetical protein
LLISAAIRQPALTSCSLASGFESGFYPQRPQWHMQGGWVISMPSQNGKV